MRNNCLFLHGMFGLFSSFVTSADLLVCAPSGSPGMVGSALRLQVLYFGISGIAGSLQFLGFLWLAVIKRGVTLIKLTAVCWPSFLQAEGQ